MAFVHGISIKFVGWIVVVAQGLLYDVPRSHQDTPTSVRLLWTSNRLVVENSDKTKKLQETDNRIPEGFRPEIPANERP